MKNKWVNLLFFLNSHFKTCTWENRTISSDLFLMKITNKIIKNYLQNRLLLIMPVYWILGWYCTRPKTRSSGWAPLFPCSHTSGVTIKVTSHIMLLHNRLEKKFPSCKWQLDKQHYRLDSMKMLQTWLPRDYKSQWIHRTLLENREQERDCACDRPSSPARWRLIEGDSVLQELSIMGNLESLSAEQA